MSKIVLLFDDTSLPYLKTGALPKTSMSHDLNLFQLAHQALNKGHQIYYSSNYNYINGGDLGQLTKIYPRLEIGSISDKRDNIRPDVAISNHIQIFGWGGPEYTKTVAVHPALYFIEMPYTYDGPQTRGQLLSARFNTDFIIVQNKRMKEILLSIYGWLSGWDDPKRILVSPLGIVAKEEFYAPKREQSRRFLQLKKADIAIVNGGGIWRWTGFNDFLRGFIQSVRDGSTNLVLVLTGFRQNENEDHGDYIQETKTILKQNKDLVGDRTTASPDKVSNIHIHIEENWLEASKKLPVFLSAADFGLNVNKDGLENWQAQRVRCLDYTKYGLPLLTTPGDYFSDHVAPGGAVSLASSTPEDVTTALNLLSQTPDTVTMARKAAARTREALLNSRAMSEAIDTIIKTGKRKADLSRITLFEAIWRSEEPKIRERSLSRVREFIGL